MAEIINPAINPTVGTGEGIDILQLYLVNFIQIALGVAGVIAFLFLLSGSLQWIMAGGDKEAVEKARKRLTGALIGLALVLLTFAIIRLVGSIFGITLTQFTIPVIQ